MHMLFSYSCQAATHCYYITLFDGDILLYQNVLKGCTVRKCTRLRVLRKLRVAYVAQSIASRKCVAQTAHCAHIGKCILCAQVPRCALCRNAHVAQNAHVARFARINTMWVALWATVSIVWVAVLAALVVPRLSCEHRMLATGPHLTVNDNVKHRRLLVLSDWAQKGP